MDDAKKTRDIKVVVIKDGEARELHNLPESIMLQLDAAYEQAPIRGLSRDTYAAMVDFFSGKLAAYKQGLEDTTGEKNEMFERSVEFAKAFGISYDESPALFDLMLQIERGVSEQKMDSRSICIRNLKYMINMDWRDANKDFRKWARRLFEDTGLRIGIIRMTKFYYGVITQLA